MLLWLSLQPPPFAPPRTLRSPRSLSSTRIIEPFTSVPFSSSSNLLMIWSSKRSILVFTTPLKKNLCELTIGNNKDSHLSAQIIVKFGIISCNCSCMCTTKIKWMIRVSKIYFSYGDSIFCLSILYFQDIFLDQSKHRKVCKKTWRVNIMYFYCLKGIIRSCYTGVYQKLHIFYQLVKFFL